MMNRLSKYLAFGMLAGLLGLVASRLPVGFGLEENIGLDLLFKLRGPRPAPAEVVIVTLDRASADLYQLPHEPEKWPRFLHARLIESLMRQEAGVIAFDIFFEEARTPADDQVLARAVGQAQNVVLSNFIMQDTFNLEGRAGNAADPLVLERLLPPLPMLSEAALATAPFPLPQIPAKIDQYWAFKASTGGIPTLPVVVFQMHALDIYNELIRLLRKFAPAKAALLPETRASLLARKQAQKPVRLIRELLVQEPELASKLLDAIQSPGHPWANDAKRQKLLASAIKMYSAPESRYLNFYGPAGAITTIPYHEALQNENRPATGQGGIDLAGKVVFIGLAARLRPELKDAFFSVFSTPQTPHISGVELAATAFANLLEDNPVEPLAVLPQGVILLLGGVLPALVALVCAPLSAAAALIGLGAGYLGLAFWQFSRFGQWYPVVIPLFLQLPAVYVSGLVWRYAAVNKERRHIKKAFGYYLPDRVVDELAHDMADLGASSQLVYGTCLFTDAEQYTALSETTEPEALSRFMQRYYQVVFEPVRRHGGIISDVIGDAMLALWATPHPDRVLRAKACNAALEIVAAVAGFNRGANGFQLPTRIGLHAGQMALGNIGAMDHYEYRAVGDVVNTTSRLEGINKYLGTRIVASAEMLFELDDFLTRELGTFLMAGKMKPVTVFELMGRQSDATADQVRHCGLFARALEAFKRQAWPEALDRFNQNLTRFKADGPSEFYRQLCREYMQNPPDAAWDGTVRLHKK